MAKRPHQELSENYFSDSEKDLIGYSASTVIKTPGEFEGVMREMLRCLDTQISKKTTDHEFLTAEVERLNDPNNSNTPWIRQYNHLKNSFTILHSTFQEVCDKENAIHRIEKTAQKRALFFRVVTTISVGLSIMVLYSVAANFDSLNMPMLVKKSLPLQTQVQAVKSP